MSYGSAVYGSSVYGSGSAPTVPGAPTGLTATLAGSQINLAWTLPSGTLTSVIVQRRAGSGAWGTLIVLGAVSSYADTGVTAGTVYTYQVAAANSVGQSPWSNEASATTPAPSISAPSAPTTLMAVAINATLVRLAWTDTSGIESGFTIERQTGAGAWSVVAQPAATATSAADSTVSPATSYTYRIRAYNAGGVSSWSNEAAVTTPSPPATNPASPDMLISVGPLRDEAPFPVIEEGADWTAPAGWEEVGWLVRLADCRWESHQHLLVLTLHSWAMDTVTFADDRQIVVRARWRDSAGSYRPWRVVFAGYVVGEIGGASIEGTEYGMGQTGNVLCKQEWNYLERTRVPGMAFGWTDLARSKAAIASSTLIDLTAEAGVEYVTAASVDPAMVTDGNLDTGWVANTVADPTPPALLTTGKTVRITEAYNGRGTAGVLGANGRSLWLELWAADVVATETFESSASGWISIRGAGVARSTAWAASGSGSLRVTAAAAGGATSKDFGGLTPEVEVAASFTVRSAGAQPVVLDVGIAGNGPTVWQKLTAPTEVAGRRYTVRTPADKHGVINLRFSSTADGQSWYMDDVRISGGVKLVEDGQPYKRLWLVWESGTGPSGYADIANYLDGLTAIGGDRSVILVDDADLFRSQFDAGGATIIPMRSLAQLAGLDFASGRGRVRLAWYRRWPDLPGDGGAIWDDLSFASLPAFTATQSLVRTQIIPAVWQARTNPAPGGAETAGSAWVNVDLGTYAAPALIAPLGTLSSEIAVLDSTAKLPAYGQVYVENELCWATKLTDTDLLLARTTPVAHGVGASVHPQVDGQKVVLPLVSAVGWRRRPGTPRLVDFDLIGSVLPSPADPSIPDAGGRTWGAHQDWFPIATVRGHVDPRFTALLGRAGDFIETVWPPPAGYHQAWGRQVRHLRLVIHRMEAWGGQGQRAKVNEIVAYEADLAGGASGEWASTSPPDIRGVVGHLLARHGGISPARIRIDRGKPDAIAWGAGYGSLPIAPGTVTEALASIERLGRCRVLCTSTNLIRLVPDPYSSSAALPTPAYTWTAATCTRLSAQRAAAHPVAQVQLSARHDAVATVYRAAYPRTPAPLGRIVTVTDRLAGSQADVDAQAAREFRQQAARWTATIETLDSLMPATLPAPLDRHVVELNAGDRAGVELAGRNLIAESWSWQMEPTEYGPAWRLSVSLRELSAWA